jgi:hypothetical protein
MSYLGKGVLISGSLDIQGGMIMPDPSDATPTYTTQSPRTAGLKRYSLVLPEDLFAAIQELAGQRQTTVVDLIRRFIKLGLIAAKIEDTPGAALIVREGDTERQIILL